MQTKTKNVYYCDYCKKHGLLRNMMERHEARCTLNPERVCHWGDAPHTIAYGLRTLAFELNRRGGTERPPLSHWVINESDIQWLYDEVDGCPACMLAALRLSGVDWSAVWTYQEEIDRYRQAERERIFDENDEADRRLLDA